MTVPVARTKDFITSIGIDTHIPYTDGGYATIANVAADLAYLGITNVRDGITNGQNGSAPLSSYVTLAQQGIKFTFVIGGGGALTTAIMNATLALMAQLNTTVPGSVVAVEGLNEINNSQPSYNGVGGLAGAINLQKDLYAAVHSNPAFAGVAVDYFTGYNAGDIAVGPDPATTAGLADFDTQHPYPNFGQAPAFWVNPAQALGNETAPYGPAVYTETGYSTNGGTGGAVNADVQGRYTLDLLMDDAKNGIARTYLYQLMDAYRPGSPQGDDGFGVFDPSNAPKAAATGIHNLMAILTDTGATASTFTARPLAYTLSGLPSTGNSMALQKSDGTQDIIVWNEPSIWNRATGTQIAVSPTNVTVTLPATYQTVLVYDPLVSSSPIQTLTGVNAVALSLTDHPLIIQVAQATVGGPVTLGTGPDSMVLRISEDAYAGNAKFTISVDGTQVGGVQTASASHAAGQDQAFTVKGNFALGPHTVGVAFLNDAYASPTRDRNLYVDSITSGGSAVPGAELSKNGTKTFNVMQATKGLVTLGSGPDSLVLQVSEDAYRGDAQFTVSIDGAQVGGIQVATASRAAGEDQAFTVKGAFAPGAHLVTVAFLNDASKGPGLDRNLYVDGATVDGRAIAGAVLAEKSAGPRSFGFQMPTPASRPLVLLLSEDAYKGDARFTVSIDAGAASAAKSVTASHAAGATQAFDVGLLAPGTHDIAVSFVNDLYGGTPGTDRNLYVTGMQPGGVAVPSASAFIAGDVTAHFSVVAPH